MIFVAVSVLLLVPPAVASAWVTFLRIENAILQIEVERLELNEMERKYRAGMSIPVAEMGRQQSLLEVAEIESGLEYFDTQILARALREGRTSPEAFIDLLNRRSRYLLLYQRLLELVLKAESRKEESDRRQNGVKRPRVTPEQFPELLKLVRKNLDLWARKRALEPQKK